jgi:nucleoside-diphosphate-sugar epimerase
MKKILITGVAGYIGSKLATMLLNKGYFVVGVDILNYGGSSINHLYENKNFKFIMCDVTNLKNIKKIIKNIDFIIPLAALVGAPLCEKFKKKAYLTNYLAIKKIIEQLRFNQKIIFPTTNSGYGIGQKSKFCTEETPLNPISLYGKTKSRAEKIVLKHKNSICFRLATVFGYSYRMRTDLLVNNFVKSAVDKKKITIYEPNFRRNYIHINDITAAFLFAIKNFHKMRSNIYNLGLSSANLTKIQLAKKIKKFLPKTIIKIIKNVKDPDQRDYFVSNKKIEKIGFKALTTLEDGIKELILVYQNSNIKIKNNY